MNDDIGLFALFVLGIGVLFIICLVLVFAFSEPQGLAPQSFAALRWEGYGHG